MKYALIVCLMIVGCKQKLSSSNTKTVDNFAAGKSVSDEKCSGLYNATGYDSKIEFVGSRKDPTVLQKMDKALLRDSVSKALTSVPPNLKKIFFETKGVKIVVSGDVVEDCKNASTAKFDPSQISSDIQGCWNDKITPPQLILKNDANSISRNTVRLFAYLIVDLGERAIKVANSSNLAADPTFALGAFIEGMKQNLAKALIEDLKRQPDSEMAKKLTEIQASSSLLADFQKATFAEVFDSLYCTAGSRSVLQQAEYSNTYKALIDITTKVDAIAVNKQETPMSWKSLTGSDVKSLFGVGGFALDEVLIPADLPVEEQASGGDRVVVSVANASGSIDSVGGEMNRPGKIEHYDRNDKLLNTYDIDLNTQLRPSSLEGKSPFLSTQMVQRGSSRAPLEVYKMAGDVLFSRKLPELSQRQNILLPDYRPALENKTAFFPFGGNGGNTTFHRMDADGRLYRRDANQK